MKTRTHSPPFLGKVDPRSKQFAQPRVMMTWGELVGRGFLMGRGVRTACVGRLLTPFSSEDGLLRRRMAQLRFRWIHDSTDPSPSYLVFQTV